MTRIILQFATILLTILILTISGFSEINVNAQGSILLRQPFGGTYRLTSYVDHKVPFSKDSKMYSYTGTEYLDCPAAGTSWTNQGPYCYDGHEGIDYALPGNTVVLAAAPGKVTYASSDTNAGKNIRIDHGNGYETLYYHLSSFSVSVNAIVIAGQQIGLSGNTGVIFGTNPPVPQPFHLHFEVRYNNTVTDPFGWRGTTADPLPGGPAVCLWGDGQCSEIVVEDRSANYYEQGSGWNWWNGGNSWTMRYVNNKQTGNSASVIWQPPLPYSGPYAISVFIPSAHATTQHAKYTIQPIPLILPAVNRTINQNNFAEDWVDLGNYDLYAGSSNVTLTNGTGEPDNTRQVGFDAVKFRQIRVHLPDVRSEYNNWDSAFYIRNDGDAITNVQITLYTEAGNQPLTPATFALSPGAQLYYNPEFNVSASDDWRGTAVVSAAEDISVVVFQQHSASGIYVYGAYTGVSLPAPEVHVPILQRNNNSLDSELFIRNTGSAVANVTVQYNSGSSSVCTKTYNNIPVNGLKIIQLSGVSCSGFNYGSAYITANQPLAVASTQYPSSNAWFMEGSNAGGSANPVYGPLIQNSNSGWTSGLTIQNASGNTNNLSNTYYKDTGVACGTYSYNNITARFPQIVLPAPPPGNTCTQITATIFNGSKAIAANVNQLNGNNASDYPGIATPGKSVAIPLWLKDFGGWTSGLAVQNVTTQSNNVTVTFYNTNGAINSSVNVTLNANDIHVILGVPVGNFIGSALVTAERPVAVSINHSRSGTGVSDGIVSHIGVHR